MRQFLQRILTEPVINLANRISSRPDPVKVNAALSDLYHNITTDPGKKGLVVPFEIHEGKFIVFSDQHKGARDDMDVFAMAEKNYLAALDHYNQNGFTFISLGDAEELWENRLTPVKKKNKATFEKERNFLNRNAFTKVFGNHDLYWDNSPLAGINLKLIFDQKICAYEGVVLETMIHDKSLDIFLTHGHQGDLQSDGNWFSKWFVSSVWAPFQAYLRINPNTPANNNTLKTDHNRIMYQWSSTHKNLILITGHTHQPVFKSFTELEILYDKLARAKDAKDEKLIKNLKMQITKRHIKGDFAPDFTGYLDTYFNSGCCCFDDGDITGIELESGYIRLIKWEYDNVGNSQRLVLEEEKLENLKLLL
jgi:predicted phosphodiesterase